MNRLVVHLAARQMRACAVVLLLLVVAGASLALDTVGGVSWLVYLGLAPAVLIATLFRFDKLRQDGEWLPLAQLPPRHTWLGPMLASALLWLFAACLVQPSPTRDTGLSGVLSMPAGGRQSAWSGDGFVLTGTLHGPQVLNRYGQAPQRVDGLAFERVSANEFREITTGERFRFRPHSPARRARLTILENSPLAALVDFGKPRLVLSHLLYLSLVVVLPLLLHRQARRFDLFTGGRIEVLLTLIPALFAITGIFVLCEAMWIGALSPVATLGVAVVLLGAASS